MEGKRASGYIQDESGHVVFSTKQRNDQTHLSKKVVNFESQKAVSLELALWAEQNLQLGTSRVQMSIRDEYRNEVESWFNRGCPNEEHLKLGTTSEALISIGVDSRDIFWDTSKINKITADHPEITIDVIKNVPGILEHPIIVMESQTQLNRITLYGDVYGGNNVPVLAVLELLPTSRGGYELNEIKLVNAYTRVKKDNPNSMTETQKLISSSTILYVDPNKKEPIPGYTTISCNCL